MVTGSHFGWARHFCAHGSIGLIWAAAGYAFYPGPAPLQRVNEASSPISANMAALLIPARGTPGQHRTVLFLGRAWSRGSGACISASLPSRRRSGSSLPGFQPTSSTTATWISSRPGFMGPAVHRGVLRRAVWRVFLGFPAAQRLVLRHGAAHADYRRLPAVHRHLSAPTMST